MTCVNLWKHRGMVERSSLEASGDVPAADWIRERLSSSESHTATSVIPSGFEAYARVLHPPQIFRDGAELVRWADVARWSGAALHPAVQWHEVALTRETPEARQPWRGQGPRQGSLLGSDAAALVDDLARFAPPSGRCFFCIWNGYGALDSSTSSGIPGTVALPRREYSLFTGPLGSAVSFGAGSGSDPQTPNLWWPFDRSWCVASEVDLPWTYVAGSRGLIDLLLGDERLEVLEASPDETIVTVVSGWLAELIERATDQVLASGSVGLSLSAGTVDVSWRSSRRRRAGAVTTRSTRHDGWSSASMPVKNGDPGELRRDVRAAVQGAVLALVEV